MFKNIKAIAVACTISITCALCFAHSAEYGAKMAAADLVLGHRNDVQHQFNQERESMKEYVGKAIDRSLSRRPTESP